MPSEYGHTLIVRQVGGAVVLGSGAAVGREMVTVEEAREWALLVLAVAADAERWRPPETPQARKNRLRRERKLAVA